MVGQLVAAGLVLLVLMVALASIPKPVIVYPWDRALLYVDGKFVRELPAGKHRFWAAWRKHEVQRLRAGPIHFYTLPIDVLTSDRFALRLAVSVVYEITDARRALETDLTMRMSQSAQAAVVTVAAQRTLEALLAERSTLGATLAALITADVPDCTIASADIGSLTLPPEIRRLVVEVERAKLEGLAALERARGEHAALRSLANAARLIKDNPELMSLRTLQAVGKGTTLVLGQGALPIGGKP